MSDFLPEDDYQERKSEKRKGNGVKHRADILLHVSGIARLQGHCLEVVSTLRGLRGDSFVSGEGGGE